MRRGWCCLPWEAWAPGNLLWATMACELLWPQIWWRVWVTSWYQVMGTCVHGRHFVSLNRPTDVHSYHRPKAVRKPKGRQAKAWRANWLRQELAEAIEIALTVHKHKWQKFSLILQGYDLPPAKEDSSPVYLNSDSSGLQTPLAALSLLFTHHYKTAVSFTNQRSVSLSLPSSLGIIPQVQTGIWTRWGWKSLM